MTTSRFANVCGNDSRTSLNVAVDLIERRRRLLQPATQRLVLGRRLRREDVQIARPLLNRVAGVDLALDDRRRVLDDVVDLRQVLLETLREVRRAVDQPLQARAQSAYGF